MPKENSFISCIFVLCTLVVVAVSCSSQDRRGRKGAIDMGTGSDSLALTMPDTLVNLTLKENLPGYVTMAQAYNSNIGITGQIGNWEERARRMEVDKSYGSSLSHKVMILYGGLGWSQIESPVLLYNYGSPILFFPEEEGLLDVPGGLGCTINTKSVFCNVNDCRFGQGRLSSLFSEEKAIAVPKSSKNVIPIFYSVAEGDSTLYSYITVCELRGKIILLSSISETKLKQTEEGCYLLNCICNYLYHGSSIDLHNIDSIDSKEWFMLAGRQW